MSVVLPAPSGPTKAVSVPCSTSRETLSSACTTSPPSRRKVFLISRPLKTFVCSARFIVSPLDVDKETRDKETWRLQGKETWSSGDKETWRHRKYETGRQGDQDKRNSSRDYPRLRFVDHCDEHSQDLVVGLIQVTSAITLQV